MIPVVGDRKQRGPVALPLVQAARIPIRQLGAGQDTDLGTLPGPREAGV